MYTLSVPIGIDTLTQESLPLFARFLTNCGVKRVFLCNLGEVYRPDCMIFTDPERIRGLIDFFRGLGIEVGIWVNAFGHGELLSHQRPNEVGDYTPMEGVDGRTAPVAYCPLDERFVADYSAGIRSVAQLGPDLIMLDDDLRFNPRLKFFRLACFCPRHLAWFYELIGEEVPRDKIEEKIFTGGPNKYRDAFLHMMGKTLLDFAKTLRRSVDGVDSTIRLGASITTAMWDFSGTDVVELSRAFAGNTRPFARISGAPYRDHNIIPIVESSRQQCAWGKDSGVELFCEGDTYPRPRYNVPSRPLELFDLAMLCDGSADGMLQYIFDYNCHLNYETGYVRRLERNMALRREAAELFAGKSAVGVQVFDAMHKFRNWVLPETLNEDAVTWIQAKPSKGAAAEVLCRNSIPTAYHETDYPVLLLGENARYITPDALKNGAILDVTAAEILQSRGIDTGLLTAEDRGFAEEAFPEETVRNIGKSGKVGIACKEGAQVESRFLPGESPASYRYENGDGLRFFVMAYRHYTPGVTFTANYLRSWCRRRQLARAVQWLCGKPLPAYLEDAPETGLLASSDGKSMAVAVLNLYQDEILEPAIRLDKPYSKLKCVNCAGRLEGDTVHLSTVSPFGFAAFEVS